MSPEYASAAWLLLSASALCLAPEDDESGTWKKGAIAFLLGAVLVLLSGAK